MTSEGLDIAILGAKILEKVCEVPVLNVLKPVAGVLVIVCETAAAMKENNELGANLASRVVGLIQTIMETLEGEDSEKGLPPALLRDVESLKRALEEINSKLRKLGNSNNIFWNMFRASSVRGDIAQLETQLNHSIRLFRLSNDLAIRRDVQSIRETVASSETMGRIVHSDFLDINREGHIRTPRYSTFLGTYDERTKVLAKTFNSYDEEAFLTDLKKRREIWHPQVARVYGANKTQRLLLLRAEGLIFASPKSRPGPRIDEDFMGCCINYEPQYSVEWHDAELDPNASPVVSGKVQTSLLEFWKSRVSVISDPNSLQDFRRSDPNLTALFEMALIIEIGLYLRTQFLVQVRWDAFEDTWFALDAKTGRVVLVDWITMPPCANGKRPNPDDVTRPRNHIQHLASMGGERFEDEWESSSLTRLFCTRPNLEMRHDRNVPRETPKDEWLQRLLASFGESQDNIDRSFAVNVSSATKAKLVHYEPTRTTILPEMI